MPPEHLWEDAKGLELWWATVEERRENGDLYGDDDGAPSGERKHPGPEMAENDLARALRD